jgi:branched-subunit amino acid transport protein
MRLWMSVLAVTIANWVLKASGPFVMGERGLPRSVRGIVSLMAPALLAGLIVVELAGPAWHGVNDPQVAGVGVAGAVWACRAPMLVAVVAGALATAGLRLL